MTSVHIEDRTRDVQQDKPHLLTTELYPPMTLIYLMFDYQKQKKHIGPITCFRLDHRFSSFCNVFHRKLSRSAKSYGKLPKHPLFFSFHFHFTFISHSIHPKLPKLDLSRYAIDFLISLTKFLKPVSWSVLPFLIESNRLFWCSTSFLLAR